MRLSEAEHWLLISVHEIGVDATSLRLIIGELWQDYVACVNGENSSVMAVQEPEQTRAGGSSEREHLQFWKRELEGCPEALDLPMDRSRPAHRSDAGDQVNVDLASGLVEEVTRYAHQVGVNERTVLLAAFVTLIHRYTGASDLIIGTEVSTRTTGTAKVISQFTNPVALRCRLAETQNFQNLTIPLEKSWQNAVKHGSADLGSVLHELQVTRNASYTPLFQVMFRFEEHPLPSLKVPSLDILPFHINSQTSQYDLALIIAKTSSGYSVTFGPAPICSIKIELPEWRIIMSLC